VLLAGCATVAHPDPRDPWESYNRTMTQFNDGVDKAVIKPVATVYKEVLPTPVRTGVGNFFGNLGDAWSFVNNVLQAKPEGALHSFWRVVVNTTIGIGGLFDPASEMHLVRHREDFGQTLGRWGLASGPYLVLPFLGPSSVRDGTGLVGDPIRPQQPGADQAHPDQRQHSTHAAKQKGDRPSSDQLPQQHTQYR